MSTNCIRPDYSLSSFCFSPHVRQAHLFAHVVAPHASSVQTFFEHIEKQGFSLRLAAASFLPGITIALQTALQLLVTRNLMPWLASNPATTQN